MMPPGIGFSPAGHSGCHGVGSFVPNRTRTAVIGLYRYAFPAGTAALTSACWRCDVTSSRIQSPRPCVPAMRSAQRHVLSSFSSRSRTEIAGMLKRSERQWSPSSNDTHTWTSVAAYKSPFFLGSSRIELATAPPAIPVLISVHVLPPSCVRQKCGLASSMRRVFAAAYAVCPSKCPASMLKMRVHGLIAAGVTFFHVEPPSVVTWMTPSSLPVQMVLMSRGDGDSAVMLPNGAGATTPEYFPVLAGGSHVCRVRSPLIRVQLCARSVDFHSAFDA